MEVLQRERGCEVFGVLLLVVQVLRFLRRAGFYGKLLLGGGCKVAQALEWHLRPSSVPRPDIYTMAMPSCRQRLQTGPLPLQCPSQVLETLLTLQEKCSKGFHHLLWNSC